MKKIIRYIVATVLMAFALLTLFLSTSVIFDLFGIRAKEGNYVLFVVLANFVSSWIYLLAVYGLIQNQLWPSKILAISVGILLAAFIGLNIHINNGGIYETKTFYAMIFRTSVTLVFALISYFLTKKDSSVTTL